MNRFSQFSTTDTNEKIGFSRAVYFRFKPIPVKKPWKDATGGFGQYAPIGGWCDIYDGCGVRGGTFCSESFVRNILPLILTGEIKSYAEWYETIYWRLRNFGFQSGEIVDLGQLDLMMLDIFAKRRSLPLHKFLGAKKDFAYCYKGGGSLLASDEALVDDMTRYISEGYKTVKFKVGSDWGNDMARDIRRLGKVRAAVGEDIEIAVDANQVFSVPEALKFAEMIQPYHVAWYEEPVHSHDMNAIKRVSERTGLTIGYGESMRNAFAFETYAEKGVKHLMPLVGRMSKMSDLVTIRNIARQRKIRFSSGGTVWLNAAFGAAFYEDGELLENHEPMTEPIGDCLKIKPEESGGRMYLPDIAGIPIQLDIEKLDAEGRISDIRYFYCDKNSNSFQIKGAY
ncbi:MAG: enolase C-terminal domain-like protein [Oscillospiraceae bacterium]